jgi:hypothetical protein
VDRSRTDLGVWRSVCMASFIVCLSFCLFSCELLMQIMCDRTKDKSAVGGQTPTPLIPRGMCIVIASFCFSHSILLWRVWDLFMTLVGEVWNSEAHLMRCSTAQRRGYPEGYPQLFHIKKGFWLEPDRYSSVSLRGVSLRMFRGTAPRRSEWISAARLPTL